MNKWCKKIVACALLMITAVVWPCDPVSAYALKTGRIYNKTATFAWGSNIQTPGSIIRNAWESARVDWANAAGINLVNNQTSGNTLNSWHGSCDGAYGVAYTTTDIGGYITQFTALINNARPEIITTNVARSVANHEIGHLAGLADVAGGGAVMNVNRVRSVIYTPQTDDINGVRASYNR